MTTGDYGDYTSKPAVPVVWGLRTVERYGAMVNTEATPARAQAAAWASTGTKTMALSAPQAVAVGYVDVLFWANGTTLPQFVRGNTLTSLANVGATTARFYKANSGLTTTAPASIGARTNSTAYLVALS